MSSTEVFRRIIAALDEAGILHMLTGFFASSLHGLTRATQDIDLEYVEAWQQAGSFLGSNEGTGLCS